MVFNLHERAVGDGGGDAEDFAVVNPRVAGDDAIALARFQQDSYEWFHNFVNSWRWARRTPVRPVLVLDRADQEIGVPSPY